MNAACLPLVCDSVYICICMYMNGLLYDVHIKFLVTWKWWAARGYILQYSYRLHQHCVQYSADTWLWISPLLYLYVLCSIVLVLVTLILIEWKCFHSQEFAKISHYYGNIVIQRIKENQTGYWCSHNIHVMIYVRTCHTNYSGYIWYLYYTCMCMFLYILYIII